jgi:hypothetical protein
MDGHFLPDYGTGEISQLRRIYAGKEMTADLAISFLPSFIGGVAARQTTCSAGVFFTGQRGL